MKFTIGSNIVETRQPLIGYTTTIDLGIREEQNTNKTYLTYSWQPHKDRYETTFQINVARSEADDLFNLWTIQKNSGDLQSMQQPACGLFPDRETGFLG